MSLALWGQDVASQAHVASSGGGWPAGQPPCFAYRGAAGIVVVSTYAQKAASDAAGEHPAVLPAAPRLFSLPVRHTVSCIAMHPSKPLLAVGTDDHGAFVVPLYNSSKGIPLGDTTAHQMGDGGRGSEQHPQRPSDASSAVLFSLDAKFISATSGSTVLAMTFLVGQPSGVPLLAVCSSKKQPSSSPSAPVGTAHHHNNHPAAEGGAASVFISLWGIEGSIARTLLWCSPPLADQSPGSILSLRACPERPTVILCTRKELSLWRIAINTGGSGGHQQAGRAPSATAVAAGVGTSAGAGVAIDVKHRPCSTIPELRGAEFVGIATPPLVAHDSDDATVGSPTSGAVAASGAASDHVFGLTTAGFLVCYDRNDGSIVKWMDCKVCPASSLVCTSTHVVVCGATVRFFSLHSWDFCGKVTADGGTAAASMDTASAASGYLASLLRGLSVAVAATRHAACVFFGNGNMLHLRLAQGAEGKKKLTLTKCLTVPAFDVAAALHGEVRFLSSANPTTLSSPPSAPTLVVMWSAAQVRCMSPSTLMPLCLKDVETTCAVVVQLPTARGRAAPDAPAIAAAPTTPVLVAFDTTFHGLIVLSPLDGFRVLGQLPVDHTVTAFVALPLNHEGPQEGGDPSSSPEAVLLAVHNTIPAQVARFTLRGAFDAFGGLERVEVVLHHCRPPRRPVSLPPPSTAAVDESLSLACTAGGILCAIVGRAMWNVRTGAVLQLPFHTTAQRTPVAVCNDRIVIASDTEPTLCVVDPTPAHELRMFAFAAPFPCAPSGLVVDGGTHRIALLRAGTQSAVAVLNMREKCAEVDRIVPSDAMVPPATEGEVGAAIGGVTGRRSGGFYFHGLAFHSGGSALVLLEGGHSGVARLKVVPVSSTPASSVGPPTAQPAAAGKKDRVPSVSPKNPSSRVGRVRVVEAVPSKQHHVDPSGRVGGPSYTTATHRRRTMSCGATPAVDELEERYAELRQMADGMTRGNTTRQPPASNRRDLTTGAAGRTAEHADPMPSSEQRTEATQPAGLLESSALRCVGTRRDDPFRRSGLLLTRQVHESKGGDVVLRLGLRWGDMSHDLGNGGDATPTKAPLQGGGRKRVFNLPVVRSHNSSIASAADGHDDDAVQNNDDGSAGAQQRQFADPTYATELLLRRMRQRDAAAAAAATAAGTRNHQELELEPQRSPESVGGGVNKVTRAAGTIEDAVRGSNVDVTDSLAQQLLVQERRKVELLSLDAKGTAQGGGGAQPHAEDAGPQQCTSSPLKGKHEVVVFHRAAGEDDDFVVCGSVADVPQVVAAAGGGQRHQDPSAAAMAAPRRHDSFAGEDDDDDDPSEVAYVQARTMKAAGPRPARAAFAATFHASSSSSMADALRNAPPIGVLQNAASTRQPQQQHANCATTRASDIKRAAERVRESLASLREILLMDEEGGADDAAAADDDDQVQGAEASSMQALNAVLADVVSTMLATSQRSRPSSAASSVPRAVSSHSTTPRGTSGRLTDDDPRGGGAVAASMSASTTTSTAAAASAAQFQLLWSEMQRMQEQNASILAAVQLQRQPREDDAAGSRTK